MIYRIFALFLFVPFSAQAIECDSESPLKVTMGDAYYDLDNNLDGQVVPKKHPLQKAIKTLESTRFRSGQASKTVCKKVDGETIAVTQTLKLKDGSSRFTTQGDLDLSVWLDDIENRDLKKQRITLPLSTAWEPGNTKNEWLLNHRFRKPGHGLYNTTNSLIELDITLTVLNGGIGVSQTTYSNGYFAEQSNWKLLKR